MWRVFSNRSVAGAARSLDDSVGADDVRAPVIGTSEALDTSARGSESESGGGEPKPWLQPSSEDALLSPPTSRSFSIIPVHVRHPLLEEWKSSAQFSVAYDYDKGWFTSESLESIRNIVERVLHGMLTPDESRSLAAIEKEHERAADGRKGRHYTSVQRRSKARRTRRRTQEYGRDRIKELAALAPFAAAAADLTAGKESQHHRPVSSFPPPPKAHTDKSEGKKLPSIDVSSMNSQSYFEPSSQSSRPDIMSQLSSAADVPFIL